VKVYAIVARRNTTSAAMILAKKAVAAITRYKK